MLYCSNCRTKRTRQLFRDDPACFTVGIWSRYVPTGQIVCDIAHSLGVKNANCCIARDSRQKELSVSYSKTIEIRKILCAKDSGASLGL